MAKILVVYHSQSGNTEAMAKAVAEGAKAVKGTEVVIKRGLEAGSEDLLWCDGVALGSPDYFSYMAGGLKDFFDRTLYPTQGKVTGKPCVLFVSHGGGGIAAMESLEKMVKSFKFTQIAQGLLGAGKPTEGIVEECRALGKTLAESVAK